jgi:glutamine synthetase
MTKYRLEYIWLDGYTPVPNLRGKTQLKEYASFPKLEELPLWGFDGSSTMQAEGHSSDCVLKPVAIYPDAARKNGALVMCEVMMPDGKTPHASNKRATILDDAGAWFGFEQEYFFYKDGRPLGFPTEGYPAPQGPYYTGVGFKNVGSVAREIVEEHLDLCLAAGINHEGINAEVAKGQWEFQIFGKGSKRPPTKCGSRATCCFVSRRSTASTSNSTASRSATPTGTAPACTRTSRPSTCARSAARTISKR